MSHGRAPYLHFKPGFDRGSLLKYLGVRITTGTLASLFIIPTSSTHIISRNLSDPDIVSFFLKFKETFRLKTINYLLTCDLVSCVCARCDGSRWEYAKKENKKKTLISVFKYTNLPQRLF